MYVGLPYYGSVMGSDEYFLLSFWICGIIPGYLFFWGAMDRWGRRCGRMVVGGLFCVATVLMPLGLFIYSNWVIIFTRIINT